MPKDRVGRPPKGPYRDKSAVFSTRITRDLRTRLDEAAVASVRSLSQEVERRLYRTFLEDDAATKEFGGAHNYALMRFLAGAIAGLEDGHGAKWTTDGGVRDNAQKLVSAVLPQYMSAVADEHPKKRVRNLVPEGLFALIRAVVYNMANTKTREEALAGLRKAYDEASRTRSAEGEPHEPRKSNVGAKARRSKRVLDLKPDQ